MNENIDLTKILDGCPKGTRFYSSVFDEVEFCYMYVNSSASKIYFSSTKCQSAIDGSFVQVEYRRCGRIYPNEGECTIFPSKDQRDWSKFERFWDNQKVERFDPNTFQPFDRVLVREYLNGKWICDIFSNMRASDKPCVCVGLAWKYCIPYNDETKHLIGTTDDCPEYYKWWEE